VAPNTVRMFSQVIRLFKEEEGQGIIEYAFILIFIAMSVILTLPSLGSSVAAKFQSINESLK